MNFANALKRFVSSPTGRSTGLSTALTLGHEISPFEGPTNAVEGLSHRGTAGQIRRYNTEFGSGWLGQMGVGALKAATSIGAFTAKTAWSGGLGTRAALGGLAGGVSAAVTNPYDNSTLTMDRILAGAAAGAGIGAMTGAVKWAAGTPMRSLKKYASRNKLVRKVRDPKTGEVTEKTQWGKAIEGWASEPGLVKGSTDILANFVGTTAKTGWQVGHQVLRHPIMAAGIAGGAYMGYKSLSQDSPQSSPGLDQGRVNPSYNYQMGATDKMLGSRYAGAFGTPSVGSAAVMMGPMQRALQNSTNGLVQGLNKGRHG